MCNPEEEEDVIENKVKRNEREGDLCYAAPGKVNTVQPANEGYDMQKQSACTQQQRQSRAQAGCAME